MSSVDLVTLGEVMISLRSMGLIAQADGFSSSIAGAETNVAIGVSRLGHNAVWVGAVGNDEPGQLVQRTLRAEGVRAQVRTDAARPTGLMLVEKRIGTTSRVTYYRAGSAGSRVASTDVAGVVAGARILHVSGITPALSDDAHDAVIAAIAEAKQSSVTVSVDLNFRAKLWSAEQAAGVLTQLAAEADLLIASDDELGLLGHDSEDAAVAAALAAGARVVVIKRGADGVTVCTAGERVDIAARRVNVVDTIGAGDAFVAGFLSGVLDQLDPVEAASRGVDVAAFAVASSGDWEGLPRRDELALINTADGEAIR